MALLRKIKSSTLMEALVATVIIISIFFISIEIINNVALKAAEENSFKLRQELNEIKYKAQSGKIQLPFSSLRGNWMISVYYKKGLKVLEWKNMETKKIGKKIMPDENY